MANHRSPSQPPATPWTVARGAISTGSQSVTRPIPLTVAEQPTTLAVLPCKCDTRLEPPPQHRPHTSPVRRFWFKSTRTLQLIYEMASRSVSVAALLAVIAAATVFQATSAFVVPEVVLMRVKRSPEPMRSFSYSGFNPNGQMAAFTGLAEYPMFGGSFGQASPYAYGPQPATQDPYGSPAATQDSYGPPPSGVAGQQTPAAADSANKQQQQYGGALASGGQQQPQEYGPPKSGAPADSREQSNNSVEQGDNKKQHRGRDGPSSNAEASFNAWFPIMFGVFPNGAGSGNGQSGNAINRGNNNQGQGQGQDQGNSYGGNGYERSSGTTVIANSVSNGRHGVATSHAIAYGNPRSSQ